MVAVPTLTTVTILTTRGNDLRLQKSGTRYDLHFLLTESLTGGAVCLINVVQQDWINFGASRKYFMITIPKFKKPEAEV